MSRLGQLDWPKLTMQASKECRALESHGHGVSHATNGNHAN